MSSLLPLISGPPQPPYTSPRSTNPTPSARPAPKSQSLRTVSGLLVHTAAPVIRSRHESPGPTTRPARLGRPAAGYEGAPAARLARVSNANDDRVQRDEVLLPGHSRRDHALFGVAGGGMNWRVGREDGDSQTGVGELGWKVRFVVRWMW
ncbi:hypothetical protein B0H12DRAFT_518258 [Mycena haematopus]|nr:hypothetical protein B0H12DRAFT_518258 [Mycena haematopus]